jgi:hypothetical protein
MIQIKNTGIGATIMKQYDRPQSQACFDHHISSSSLSAKVTRVELSVGVLTAEVLIVGCLTDAELDFGYITKS